MRHEGRGRLVAGDLVRRVLRVMFSYHSRPADEWLAARGYRD
jgi:hypothetical protein